MYLYETLVLVKIVVFQNWMYITAVAFYLHAVEYDSVDEVIKLCIFEKCVHGIAVLHKYLSVCVLFLFILWFLNAIANWHNIIVTADFSYRAMHANCVSQDNCFRQFAVSVTFAIRNRQKYVVFAITRVVYK